MLLSCCVGATKQELAVVIAADESRLRLPSVLQQTLPASQARSTVWRIAHDCNSDYANMLLCCNCCL